MFLMGLLKTATSKKKNKKIVIINIYIYWPQTEPVGIELLSGCQRGASTEECRSNLFQSCAEQELRWAGVIAQPLPRRGQRVPAEQRVSAAWQSGERGGSGWGWGWWYLHEA